MTDARNNATAATYDTAGRMVELVSPDDRRTEWRYDLAGNLRAKQMGELSLRVSSSGNHERARERE
ncbi:RHS repeat domain-containing protein [Sorangium sp. So ce1128]